jgi:hypothetical protein
MSVEDLHKQQEIVDRAAHDPSPIRVLTLLILPEPNQTFGDGNIV